MPDSASPASAQHLRRVMECFPWIVNNKGTGKTLDKGSDGPITATMCLTGAM